LNHGAALAGFSAGTRYAELVPPTDDWSADVRFQSAFVAVSYFAGTRDPAELAPFAALARAAERLCAELGAPDRAARAAALSRELGVIVGSIEARRLA